MALVFDPNVFQNDVFQVGDVAPPVVEVLDPGSRIIGGQFSRRKWRTLQEQFHQQATQEREARERRERAAREAAKREEEQRRAEVTARRQAEDELARIVADHRAMMAAEQAALGAQATAGAMSPDAAIRAAVERARLLQEDEEEAIALLMLS